MKRLSVEQVATELGIRKQMVRELCKQGKLGVVIEKEERSQYLIYEEWLNKFKEGWKQ